MPRRPSGRCSNRRRGHTRRPSCPRLTRSLRVTANEYRVVPAGSNFVAAATINVTGTATGPNDVTPCPATVVSDRFVHGDAPTSSDACAAWADDGVELHPNANDLINPDESLCSSTGTATPVCSTKIALASVIAVDGPTTVRRADGTTVPAVPGTPLYLGDEVFTEGESVAAIEFAVGGKIGDQQRKPHSSRWESPGARSARDRCSSSTAARSSPRSSKRTRSCSRHPRW